MKDQNKNNSTKNRVLSTIKQFGCVSIKDIATYCSQSIPNVTHYVEEMLSEGLLQESITPVVTNGRKPRLISLNPAYGYFVGVDLGLLNVFKIGFFSFDGVRISSSSFKYGKDATAEETIENVMASIEAQFVELKLDPKRLLYIVISNPGVVTPETGSIIMSASIAKWRHLPLRTLFCERFDVATKVINDVNLSAIGEKEYGLGNGYQNFVFIRVGIGLKAGIILKDRLYQGESCAAGEIGYSVITVEKNNRHVRIPAEEYLSVPAICARIADQLEAHPNDIFYSLTGGNTENVTVDNIVKVLGADSFVCEVIREAGEVFGYVLANLVAAIDIALIIVSGEIERFNNYFFKPAREVLTEQLVFPPTMLVSTLGGDVALLGAFCVGIENFIASVQ